MNKISKYAMEATEAKYQQGDSTLRFATVEDGDIVFTVKGGESNFNEQGRVIITGKEILFGVFKNPFWNTYLIKVSLSPL